MSYYGQKNYLAIQGIPDGKNYRIDEIGCLLTSIANYEAWKKGVQVDPVALNGWFISHNDYIDAAPKDGILDDLSWSSLTQYDPSVTIAATGSGSPSVDGSFVEFRYNSLHSGQPISHFCLMIDAANGVIVDAYDGLVKSPSQYESVYGKPVAWCAYTDNEPVQVTATTVDNHPTGVDITGKKLFLPAAAGTWRVYPLDKTPVVGNEVGKLAPGNPSFAPGLTYDIIGSTQWANVYRIHTETWGDVNIYAGPDTIAQFVDAAPAAPAPETPAPVIPEPPKLQIIDSTAPTVPPAAPAESAGETIPVKVVPTVQKPEYTAFTDGPTWYHAIKSVVVEDVLNPDVKSQLVENQPVLLAGSFTYQGYKSYRTAKSVQNDLYVAIPLTAVKLGRATDDELLGSITDSMKREFANTSTAAREATVKKAGAALGKFARLLIKLHIIKPKGTKK
jgi:hypothetical protein